MNVLHRVRTLFGRTNLHVPNTDELRKIAIDLHFSTKNMWTLANGLVSLDHKPAATYERDCDYYDECPFRVSTKAKQDELRRMNAFSSIFHPQMDLFGPKNST